MSYTLNNGDKFESQNTSIEILDQDRLCYLVKNNSANGATGIRTISKKLVNEFVEYLKDHPNAKAEEARDELKTGPSGIDNYEYGYAATLLKLAQRALDNNANGEVAVTKSNNKPLQQIFYGAPGTGKSYKIKEMIKTVDHIRTTFHPDSDYSTFVGAYKPTTIRVPVRTMIGKKTVIAKDENNNALYEDKIVYKFVPQAFLQAYVRAWKKYSGVSKIEEVEDEILVIEEINRGNCAQIFGDLFQLLDRKDAGFSEYPITADADMKKYLEEEFEKINLDKVKGVINGYYKGEDNDKDIDICRQVLDGDILLLPNNLYIWATMNTSDQSLFPIDSAFKRRWDWQYVPISNAGKDWVISVNGNKYDWWEFLTKINENIYDTTHSEDKKLGYFFCKAKDGVIDAEMFVGKVIFYLWNDVFKDMEFEDGIFKDGEDGKLSFDKFYKVEKGETKVDSGKVEKFLKNLELEPKTMETTEINSTQTNGKNNDEFIINNNSSTVAKRNLVNECIKEYMKLNPTKTAQDILDEWRPLNLVRHFIETEEEFNERTDLTKEKRSEKIDCLGGGSLYVATDGYTDGNIDDVIKKIEERFDKIKIKRITKIKDDPNNSQNYEQDNKSPIKVTYNGKSYDGKNAMDMLKKLIKDIGVERVRGIQENGKIAGYYMIVDDDIIKESNNKFFKSKDKVESMKNNHEIGKGLYLFSNTSSLYKVTQLKEIKKKLNLDLEAEII
jgi:hypothetical protein